MDNNYFVITKTVPGNVVFRISPITNSEQYRVIELTEKMPSTRLPKDWALGVFLDQSLFNMFKKGIFTFDDVKAVTQLAIQEQVYFGEELEFEPRPVTYVKDVLGILKSGKRTEILAALKEDQDHVLTVATEHINELTGGVVSLLEKESGRQLRIDEE